MKSLKELRERARACSNADARLVLFGAADLLDGALDNLWRSPTADNLRTVNCAWAVAHKALKGTPPEADPQSPLAGAPVAALLAA